MHVQTDTCTYMHMHTHTCTIKNWAPCPCWGILARFPATRLVARTPAFPWPHATREGRLHLAANCSTSTHGPWYGQPITLLGGVEAISDLISIIFKFVIPTDTYSYLHIQSYTGYINIHAHTVCTFTYISRCAYIGYIQNNANTSLFISAYMTFLWWKLLHQIHANTCKYMQIHSIQANPNCNIHSLFCFILFASFVIFVHICSYCSYLFIYFQPNPLVVQYGQKMNIWHAYEHRCANMYKVHASYGHYKYTFFAERKAI